MECLPRCNAQSTFTTGAALNMFSLIQRGQLYIDGNGYPVQVHSCSASHV
ncbi:DUF4222 domain-containing protein, partial [Salmonella enterica]|nr:DUF4222 domain-containing protein [Salmonella enterica]EBP9303508.1 DUF4222 domain-containing protein [Salmonella enterica]